MSLSIAEITSRDLEEIIAFATPFELDALQRFPAIPRPVDGALATSIERRFEHGSGVVARQGGAMVGLLHLIGPIPDFRPESTGIYAPLSSCLTTGDSQDRVITTMLTEVGNLPQFAGVNQCALSCYPHNRQLNRSLALNGFGVRCADAVTLIADLPADVPDTGLTIEEIYWRDAVQIIEAKESLATHLASSPMFMEKFAFTSEFVAWKSEERESVHLVARDGERIVGFIEATYEGENYLTRSPLMRNICGAGVLPEYRNRGIMYALLIALANKYREEGIVSLGVDYETFNPNARRFWERYFTPYTRSWERHFDMPWGHV